MGKVKNSFNTGITRSQIDPAYGAGCMNVAVAAFELSVDKFGIEPRVISLEQPNSLGGIDHFVLAFGYFNPGEYANIETFHDDSETWYLDTKGTHSELGDIIRDLYQDEDKVLDAGIFEASIIDAKSTSQYDDSIKNKFKMMIEKNMDS